MTTNGEIGVFPDVDGADHGGSLFTGGEPNFDPSTQEFRQNLRFEVANVALNTTTNPGDELFVLQLDSTLDPWLLGYQFFTLENCLIQMHCTSPLGTGSGALILDFMADPANADIPILAQTAIDKFGQTEPATIVRPRDNKKFPVNVKTANPKEGAWRYVKRDTQSSNLASYRQTCFGAYVAIVVAKPSATDGAVFSTWFSCTMVGRGRTINTEGTVAKTAQMKFGGNYSNAALYQDEQSYGFTANVNAISTTDYATADIYQHASIMYREGVLAPITCDKLFQFTCTLVDKYDDQETQEVVLSAPLMYFNGNADAETGYFNVKLPFPPSTRISLIEPYLLRAAPIDCPAQMYVQATAPAPIPRTTHRAKRTPITRIAPPKELTKD